MHNEEEFMRTIVISIVLILFICCGRNNSISQEKFIGTWALDCFEYHDENTDVWIADSTRSGYKGFIIYDGQGHMSVQITPGEYDSLDGQIDFESVSCDSLKNIAQLYSRNYSYFASYFISDNVILLLLSIDIYFNLEFEWTERVNYTLLKNETELFKQKPLILDSKMLQKKGGNFQFPF
jgi:hypothetical protein